MGHQPTLCSIEGNSLLLGHCFVNSRTRQFVILAFEQIRMLKLKTNMDQISKCQFVTLAFEQMTYQNIQPNRNGPHIYFPICDLGF